MFPGQQKVHADWFTGVLLLAKGLYGSGVFGMDLHDGVLLAIENGIVVKTEELKNFTMQRQVRVGLTLKIEESKVLVESITPFLPAYLSEKFQVGDELVRMSCPIWGEKDFKDKNLDQIVGYIRGIKGTSIHLFKKSSGSSIVEEVILER